MGIQQTRYKTQWAAQFYAAAELTRRGYLVSLTFGNASVVDLLVQSPKGIQFTIDIKGQSTKSFWLIQNRQQNNDHYFILVFLSKNMEQPKYFIMSSNELMKRRKEYERRMAQRGRYRDDLGGINWSTAFDYENHWDNLPC